MKNEIKKHDNLKIICDNIELRDINEHEALKFICDKIEFNYSHICNFYKTKKCFGYLLTSKYGGRKFSVKEIIFTPGFRDKLQSYYLRNITNIVAIYEHDCVEGLMYDLDNEVKHILNVLNLEHKFLQTI